MGIISQYIHTSNHDPVHLKLTMLYINYMSTKLEKNKIAKKKIIFLKIFHHKKKNTIVKLLLHWLLKSKKVNKIQVIGRKKQIFRQLTFKWFREKNVLCTMLSISLLSLGLFQKSRFIEKEVHTHTHREPGKKIVRLEPPGHISMGFCSQRR